MTKRAFQVSRRLRSGRFSDARRAYHVVHSLTRFDARQLGVKKSAMHEWMTLPAAWRRRSPTTGGGQLLARAQLNPELPGVAALRVLAGSGNGLWVDELEMRMELAARKAHMIYMRALARGQWIPA